MVRILRVTGGWLACVLLSSCVLFDSFQKVDDPDAGSVATSYRRGVWYLLDSGTQAQACSGPGIGHYRYIIIQWYMAVDPTCGIAQIKAANPNAKILAYQNFGAMIAGPHTNGRPSTTITQEEANVHESGSPGDSWFLHDGSSGVLTYSNYPLKPGNIGRATYRAQATAHVDGILADGFDGIVADDVNTFPGHGLGEGATAISEYPTDNAYGDAMVAAITTYATYVKSKGLLLATNVGVNPWNVDHRSRALQISSVVDLYVREFWMRWNGGGDNFRGAEWGATATLMSDVEDQGQTFLAMTSAIPSNDGAQVDTQYAAASFWLMWDGVKESAWGMSSDMDFDEALWGKDIGLPTDAERVASGVAWIRHYSAGVAVVNPHATTTQVVPVGGVYTLPDGGTGTELSLPPAHGAVLTR